MIEWADGLRLRGTPLHLDARQPRPLCVVSHAHSDHIACHRTAVATPETLALAEIRCGVEETIPLDYYADASVAGVNLRLVPAGHVLGSAMVRAETSEGVMLYTGDFKLRPSRTVTQADPCEADVLVMESTYGKPMFRFPPWQETADRMVNLVGEALKAGRQPVVMGYSLGKAQEIVKLLTDAGFPVTEHGAVAKLSDQYERFGVDLGPRRRYAAADFRGKTALPLEERGVLVAPPNVSRSSFVTQFDNPLTIMMSGWGLLKGAEFRYGVNHVLPISDHADFDELLELIDRVKPKKVYTLHGFPEFAETLRRRGINASLAKPDAQMSLFE